MGKGTIITNKGAGLYSVQINFDRGKTGRALEQINAWLVKVESEIDAVPVGDPKHVLPGLKLRLASLQKQKAYIESIPADTTVDAWCADRTEDLSGEVGTVEVNGDDEKILLRPGYSGQAFHIPARDGQLTNIMAMTAEQAYYNLAMKPGWQRWMPTYRVGTITGITEDTCSVNLDPAAASIAGYLTWRTINEAEFLTSVPIEYMDCNGAAFEVGSRVVVQFTGQAFDSPKVIGFEMEPRECLLCVAVDGECRGGSKNLYWYSVSGTLLKTEAVLLDETFYPPPETAFDDPYVVGPEGIVKMEISRVRPDMNGILLRVFCDAPSGLGWPEHWYDSTYFKKKIPLKKRADEPTEWVHGYSVWQPDGYFELIAPNVEHQYMPKTEHYAESGLVLTCTITHFYSGAFSEGKYGSSMFHGSGLTVDGSLFMVSQTIYPNPPPSNYLTRIIYCVCPSSYRGKYLMAICEFDATGFEYEEYRKTCEGEFLDAYVAWWSVEDIPAGYHVWRDNYISGTGGILGKAHRLFTLTKNEFHQLKQIECHDDMIYVFSDSGEGTRFIPGNVQPTEQNPYDGWPDISQSPRIRAYDFSGNLHRANEYSGYSYIDPAYKINYQARAAFCFQMRQSRTGDYSPIQVIDTETLAVVRTIPLGGIQKPAAMVSVPATNYMLEKVNALRAVQPWVWREEGTRYQRLPYMGYSAHLSAIARVHLEWCAANCRLSHEDVNGDLIAVWGVPLGVYYAGDNLALISKMGSLTEEIDAAMAGWTLSPHHFANMVVFDTVTMGWAVVDFPMTCTEITHGPGMYKDGAYTTEDETVPISGPHRMFMQIFAVG